MNNNTRIRLCAIDGCNGEYLARGYCNKHYLKLKRYGDPLYVKEKEICKIDGCNEVVRGRKLCKTHYFEVHNKRHYEKYKKGINGVCKFKSCKKPAYIRGYCAGHYQRLLKYGDPSMSVRAVDLPETCRIEGCNEVYHAKGLCKTHYNSKRRKEFLQSEEGREKDRIHRQRRRARIKKSPFNDFSNNDWEEGLKEFENSCAYCGTSDEFLEQEHVIPISLGGSNTKTNIIPSCSNCNQSKGGRLLEEWYPKQPYYEREREQRILEWMGYKPKENKIQMQLF